MSENLKEEKSVEWGLWKHLAWLLDSRCTPECNVRPECIEHCRAIISTGDEGMAESEDPPTYRSVVASVLSEAESVTLLLPASKHPKQSGQSSQFALHWADLQGMPEQPISISGMVLMHHSLLPVRNGQVTGGSLPAPLFLCGISMKACLYKADKSDSIDIELHKTLQSLPVEGLNVLALRRVEPGEYDIDGRHVHIYRGGEDGMVCLVHEDDVNAGIEDMPLRTYIHLVANVAVSLHRRGVSPSFKDEGASTKTNANNDDNDNRYNAMRLACTQAELRQLGF